MAVDGITESTPLYTATAERVDAKPDVMDDKNVTEETEIRVKSSSNVDEVKGVELSSKEKGDAFEDFVVNLLADWRLKLLDRTQDRVSTAGVVAESCKNPDLHILQKRGKSEVDYYLECKYRSRWNNDEIEFEEWQIKRYKQFQRDNRRKVIIALGVGGSPSNPATLMLVPVDSIVNSSIRKIKTQFAIQPTSDALVSYIDNYFTEVFRKSASKAKPA